MDIKPKTKERYYIPIAGISILIILIQLSIDAIMGGEAEYFNAYATVTNLTTWLHGYTAAVPMIYKQEELGMWALPAAMVILIGIPITISILLLRIYRFLSTFLTRRMEG